MTEKTTALMIMDVQNDTVSPGGAFESSGSTEHAAAQNLIGNLGRLLEAARSAQAPVFHVHFIAEPAVEGATYNAPLFEAVAASGGYLRGSWGAAPPQGVEPAPGEIVLEKNKMSAFAGTGLEEHLQRLGVDQLVIAGALTNMAVEHTARHAADAGYHVVVVSDGTSTLNADWQAAATGHALTMVAQILDTEQSAALLSSK